MKKIIYLLILFVVSFKVHAQSVNEQETMYYTCKVWGYVKYFHSEVSNCEYDWNEFIYRVIPDFLDVENKEDLNYVLNYILDYPAPMKIATTPPPDEIPLELRRNLNLDWFNDPLISDEVREKLELIRDNFRPYEPCWVINNDGSNYGWLAFPFDAPILGFDTRSMYPNESMRLTMFFSYWNILNYYNPNKYILSTPWDSVLYNYIPLIREAQNRESLFRTIQQINYHLEDAHTEGLTSIVELQPKYSPRLLLKNVEDEYVVIKSSIYDIDVGDIINKVEGKTPKQWEDSLWQYISAGNPSVFERFMNQYMLRGGQDTNINIELLNKQNIPYNVNLYRDEYIYDDWFYDYEASTELKGKKWEKLDCNVGFANLGNLYLKDVNDMMTSLQETEAIIFDLRYGNLDNTAWDIADYLYPEKKPFVQLTMPDVNYPGTYKFELDTCGWMIKGHFEGKVIILCDENTQSSMEYSSMILKAARNATIIGSQTAGADGNITVIQLTDDIRTGFSSLGVYYPDGTQTQKIGIVPDIEVHRTIEGIREGRDEVLEKALEVAGCDVSAVEDKEIIKFDPMIYPNPSSGKISVANFEGSLKVYNTHGQIVFESNILNGQKIDLKELVSGLYFVEMAGMNFKIVNKLIILH